MSTPDCDFYYFKPGGKWKYEGEGLFPRSPDGSYYEVDHAAISRENNGMPGISSDALSYIIVVIPRKECGVPTAYPRLIHAVET